MADNENNAEPEASGGDSVELTAREMAIIQGKDPDQSPIEEESVEDIEETAEETVDEETPVGGTDDVGESKDSDDVGKDAPPTSWIDDTVKERAKALSMTEDELAVFPSLSEFNRVASIMDRAAKSREPAPEAEPPEETEVPNLDVQHYIDEQYDESTINLVKFAKATHDTASALRDELQQSRMHLVHLAMDGMDEQLYGRGESVSDEQEGNREKLFTSFRDLAAVKEKAGETVSLHKLLKQAQAMTFGDVLRERDKKEMQAKLSAQSKKRRAVAEGNTKRPTGSVAAEKAVQSIDDIVNHHTVIAKWEELTKD